MIHWVKSGQLPVLGQDAHIALQQVYHPLAIIKKNYARLEREERECV